MQKKNLTLIFNHFDEQHLGKDVFLVPYYLGKRLEYDVTIVYPLTELNRHFPDTIKGVKLVPLKFKKRLPWLPVWRTLNFYLYLLTHAKRIDLLMRFHYSLHSELMIVLYKLLNKKGKAYLKLDGGTSRFNDCATLHETHQSRSPIRSWLIRRMIRLVDCVSCETSDAYQRYTTCPYPDFQFGDKLVWMSNGFDEELLQSFSMHVRTFAEKKNLMITVGRLGTPQKNTEMILKALEHVDMKDWKFLLIGPIEESFKPTVEAFYREHPEKRTSVVFTGPEFDKKKLWEYYNKAKVFVLSSRWESYGLVLNEAWRFQNYLVSTHVGAAPDLIESNKYGETFENPIQLSMVLTSIISGTTNIDVYSNEVAENISWAKMIKLLRL